MDKLTFDEMAARYCERQEPTPDKLLEILKTQRTKQSPVGWFLAECQMMGSSYMASLVIMPYGGPDNTFQEIPMRPFSPRGLASDQSVAVAYTLAAELPFEAGPWIPPPEPAKKKGGRKRC